LGEAMGVRTPYFEIWHFGIWEKEASLRI
jgi:hypothetical protein